MANLPFERVVLNVRERPLSTDINQAQSQIDRTLRHVLDQFLVPRAGLSDERAGTPVSGFVGNGFAVSEDSPAGLGVLVKAGLGFYHDSSDTPSAIGSVGGVDDLSRYKPLLLMSDAAIAVPAPDPTNPRIDIVEVAINRRLTDPASRDVLNLVSGVFEPTSVNKTLAWDVGSSVGVVVTPSNSTTAIGYKQGIASATPSIPPTSPGYVKVAEVLVSNGVAQINQNDVNDLRLLLGAHGGRHVTAKGTFNAGVVTLDALQAPPGVKVAFNDSGGNRRMYVKAGDVASASPIAHATREGGTISSIGASVVNTDTALQTALNTAADTDPIIPVVDDYPGLASSGQKLIRVDLQAVDDTFHVTVGF